MQRCLGQRCFGIKVPTGQHRSAQADGQHQHAKSQTVKHGRGQRHSRTDTQPGSLQKRHADPDPRTHLGLARHPLRDPGGARSQQHDSSGGGDLGPRAVPGGDGARIDDQHRFASSGHLVDKLVVAQHHPHLVCFQRGGERGGAELRVHQHDVGTDQPGGKRRRDKVAAIAAHDAHGLPGPDAGKGELPGDRFGHRLNLAVAQRTVVVDDCGPLRPPCRRDSERGVEVRTAPVQLADQPQRGGRAGRAEQPRSQ
ncbi:Long-chain-fatty-acid--CoA ligase [Mycobacterium marinum MB2]|nr:Long-chain-fatty-acid--CoA ligase [Mycobacterium marinum MB2]